MQAKSSLALHRLPLETNVLIGTVCQSLSQRRTRGASPPVDGPGGDCCGEAITTQLTVGRRSWSLKEKVSLELGESGEDLQKVKSALKSEKVSRRRCTRQRQQPMQRPRGGKELNPQADIRCEGQGWENRLYNLFLKVILEARLIQPIFTEFSLWTRCAGFWGKQPIIETVLLSQSLHPIGGEEESAS